jgi:hypothetical protein
MQALQVDWMMIQGLYLKGLTPKQIQAETGVKADTVSNRAFRCKWRKSLVDSAVVVHKRNQAMAIDEPDTQSLTKHSDSVRNALGRDLTRLCELLETAPPPSLSNALKRQQALEPAVRNAKAVFGWSEGQSQPSVRINVMGTVSVHSGSENGSNAVPAIDQDKAKVIELE